MSVELTVRLRNTSDTTRLLAALQEIGLIDMSSTAEPTYDFDATAGRDISCKCCGHTSPDMRAHLDNNETKRIFDMLVHAGAQVLDQSIHLAAPRR